MTDIQGALGCAQMDRADWILDERRRRARLYDEALADVDWLRTPTTPAGNVHGYQSYCCLFAPEEPTLAASDAAPGPPQPRDGAAWRSAASRPARARTRRR